ncbi:2OG-Fe(II) oxygenase [Pseudemcibacter aquimaris]|uniref:2OG-Fe(II) oxygenase n=1 Tax=Pseudemcibacter aquimaris TaxID=2857064 RepID=UPI002011FCD4|nr:2OG-Fe(II) oxygenase [Pseudemcibacter aquimaris]MCC3861155.1 2OG-Fe(II) oxygenase [Pseudemcibacter aquimaris]WDU59972.1 2OG-Fe(II) oxygenase [Pseudemcibacter aquimaris]
MQAQTNWKNQLLQNGFVKLSGVLTPGKCKEICDHYNSDIYRSTINMKRYNFGQGEYKYYSYPLPEIITKLRQHFYQELRPVAKEWSARLERNDLYPDNHDDYLKKCHDNDQTRPTPLILKYGPDDFNTLHQDLYGEIHFPYQVAIMLSDSNDYSGGEFTLVEQRPRMQSVAHVENLKQGEAIIFAVNEFPKQGSRGYYRAKLRHGVSKVRSGRRHTLGIILHDAK